VIQPIEGDGREEQGLEDNLGKESELQGDRHLGVDKAFQGAWRADIRGKDADNEEGSPKREPPIPTMEERLSEKEKNCSEEKSTDWLEEWPCVNYGVGRRPEVLGDDWIGKAR